MFLISAFCSEAVFRIDAGRQFQLVSSACKMIKAINIFTAIDYTKTELLFSSSDPEIFDISYRPLMHVLILK